VIEIYLAGEPIGKGRPRFVKATGRAFTPERTVRFEDRLSLAAQNAMNGRPLLEGPLLMSMVVVKSIPKSWPKKRQEAARRGEEKPTVKPDWDNHGKVCDALNLVVWADDAQIVQGDVTKIYGDTPCTLIRVAPHHGRLMPPTWAVVYFGKQQSEGAFE